MTPSARSTVATCWEMPDWVAFSRSAARVNEPSSQTAMTARICRSAIPVTPSPDIRKTDATAQNILFRLRDAIRLAFAPTATAATNDGRQPTGGGDMGTANFGIAGLDWQQRVNWDRMRKYRTERAREHDEEARPRRHAVHVRRERSLHHRHAHAGLEPAQAGPALRACCAATASRSCSSRAISASRSSVTRRGCRRRTSATPCLDQRRGRSGIAAAGEEIHQRDHRRR